MGARPRSISTRSTGDGPVASRHLYDQQDRGKLRVENGGLFEDVPRDADKTAIIGDPRNDENLIISGLHAAFLFAHNRALDTVRQRGRSRDDGDGFEEARRLLRWHYQWLIVHEFLPLFVGQPMVDDILKRGRRFYTPQRAFMPVDFLAAANRFGHSTVRPSYRAPTWPGMLGDRSSASSSTRLNRVAQIRPTWSAARARRDASSAGRPSSTSATVRSRTPSASIRTCRRRCSTCRTRRVPATSRPRRCRSGRCSNI